MQATVRMATIVAKVGATLLQFDLQLWTPLTTKASGVAKSTEGPIPGRFLKAEWLYYERGGKASCPWTQGKDVAPPGSAEVETGETQVARQCKHAFVDSRATPPLLWSRSSSSGLPKLLCARSPPLTTAAR
jgi:hypothetical protein